MQLRDSIVCEASRISEAQIERSIIGIRSIIGRGCRVIETIMMGADLFEASEQPPGDKPPIPIGVGSGCVIERAIIDKNARIGDGVTIRNADGRPNADGKGYCVRDGIVIVPKNAVIPAGTVI